MTLIKKSDTVTIISYNVPTIDNIKKYKPRIAVRTNVEVIKAGEKIYSTGMRNNKQKDIGEVVEGMVYHTYRIVLRSATDYEPYVTQVKDTIEERIKRVSETLTERLIAAKVLAENISDLYTIPIIDDQD